MAQRKMKRKFTRTNVFQGRVGDRKLAVSAKTKHEATKKLRKLFRDAGIPTQPTPLEDLLGVSNDF